MKTAIIDVEATCWDKPEEMAKNQNEVIEIGYTIVDNNRIISSGDIYVKPSHSEVSPFCEKLTGITKQHLDKVGLSAREAYSKLNNVFSGVDAWASYGNYDKIILGKMEIMNQVKINMPATHYNVREMFAKKIEKNNDPKVAPSNPKLSMEKIGMKFIGRNHNGADDAKNIALLFNKLNSELK